MNIVYVHEILALVVWWVRAILPIFLGLCSMHIFDPGLGSIRTLQSLSIHYERAGVLLAVIWLFIQKIYTQRITWLSTSCTGTLEVMMRRHFGSSECQQAGTC